ncbi:MAG: tRNA uridine-5-carboxymethylaminomethyl(34) synthesis GTPase MnmE [Rhizobiaceae bacterium]|nr:tRNA uridine-5-carboxymethylaminomethyl(34) synthesis GTPase MnmE [Rhizobiaceae bacterium]MCV0404662.1 tRNA uridine-5-carboxymethylaminomethyl(34) synthesis GTPase MnmE [Rhizobiaceae bacterium]
MASADSLDTIYALSSGSTPSGVGVIRLSGPKARFALETIFGKVPPPRRLVLGRFTSEEGIELDRGLAVFLPGPATFTGEDCAEFHCHGGTAVVKALLDTLGRIEGLRQAQAGEFTRRAFLNGRVDLSQAEALADLISAETEAQRRLAVDGAGDALPGLYAGWRERILHARAMIEAELDFADEDDIPGSVSDVVWEDLGELALEIARHAEGYRRAEIIRGGFSIVIAGPPNVGKSSLLNALAQREVAIVSEIPGTTRDVIEVSLDLGGYKVIISDTAGLRESDDRIETMGISRAKDRIASAHLVLVLRDLAEQPEASSVSTPEGIPVLRVATKADLTSSRLVEGEIAVSARTGTGMDRLIAELERIVSEEAAGQADLLPSRLRHVDLLESCRSRLTSLTEMPGTPLELEAETLRLASDDLGRIAGHVTPDDLLDRIFSSFCIGK